MPKTTVVIPCYNEESRFDKTTFENFVAKTPDVNFILVNDGGTDNTIRILEHLCQQAAHRFELLSFSKIAFFRIPMLAVSKRR